MSSKRRVMKKRNVILHDSDSESDAIQQPQTVAPSRKNDAYVKSYCKHESIIINEIYNDKDMDDITSFTEGQLALLNRQYVELKYEIKQIFKKLEGIERLLNNIAVNANNTSQNILCYIEERSFLDQLPLKSVAEVTNFDTIIAESSEKFNLLVQLLYLVGGDTNNKIIYKDEQINVKPSDNFLFRAGKKKKLPFINLKLYDAVTVATRRRQASITDMEIKNIVSLFLATAKSRIKT